MKKNNFEVEQIKLKKHPLRISMTESEVQLSLFYDLGLMSGAEFVLLRDALYYSEGFAGFEKLNEEITYKNQKKFSQEEDDEDDDDAFEKMMRAKNKKEEVAYDDSDDELDDTEEEIEKAELSINFEDKEQIESLAEEYMYLKDTTFFFNRFDLMAAFSSLKYVRTPFALKCYETGVVDFCDEAEENFFYNCSDMDNSSSLVNMDTEKKFLLSASAVYAAIEDLKKSNKKDKAETLHSRLSLILNDVPEFFFENKKEGLNRLMQPIKTKNERIMHQKFLNVISKFFKPTVLSLKPFGFVPSEKFAMPLSEKEVLERLILTRDLAQEAVMQHTNWTPKHKDCFLDILQRMAIPKATKPITIASKSLKKKNATKGRGRSDD